MPQDVYTDKTNEELLLTYKETKDKNIKQELTMRYVPLVKRIALQMRDVYVSFTQLDDIINEGVLAIMSAIDKFEPDKNVKFESFVAKRIRGMVIDIARKNDWVPRGTRKTARNIENICNELYNLLGREPTVPEIADGLNMTVEQYYEEERKSSLFNVLSLDMLMEEGTDRNWTPPVLAGDASSMPEQQYLEGELRENLQSAIQTLRENEQLVISLYYLKEVNFKSIAEIMRVSEPRVSQIHSNAIRKIKKYMEQFYTA